MRKIGFANKYYTLWEVYEEDVFVTVNNVHRQSGIKTVHNYIQNLSMDESEAKKKFTKMTGLDAPEVDSELYGRSNSYNTLQKFDVYEEDEFNKGKYIGDKIKNVTDIDYLLFAYENMYTGIKEEARRNIIKSILLDNGYLEHPIDEDKLVTQDGYEYAIQLQKEKDLEASLIEDHHFNHGEKVELELTVHEEFGFSGTYGYTNVYKFYDSDKRSYTYMGTKSFPLRKGDKVSLIASIKHDSYNGQDQTKLLRIKVL